MVSPPAITHCCLAVAQALQTCLPSLRKLLAKLKIIIIKKKTYSRIHSILLDWQPRHGPQSSVSTSLRWRCQNSSSDSSSHHPCSFSSRSASRAASTCRFLSSSSCCFLSTSHFSSSSAACAPLSLVPLVPSSSPPPAGVAWQAIVVVMAFY